MEPAAALLSASAIALWGSYLRPVTQLPFDGREKASANAMENLRGVAIGFEAAMNGWGPVIKKYCGDCG